MEDASLRLLKELEKLSEKDDLDSKLLERFSRQLSDFNELETLESKPQRLIELGGLLSIADDVLALERGSQKKGGFYLRIHLAGIGSKDASYEKEDDRNLAAIRLLRELGGEKVARPFGGIRGESIEGDWIELGSLQVRTRIVLGIESGPTKDGAQLIVHLAGLDSLTRDYRDASECAKHRRNLAACVFGKDWESLAIRP